MQQSFKNELELLVDMLQQRAGNTNDGHTARKSFRNAEKSAEITGINLKLNTRFHVILECLNCSYHINLNKFEEYIKHTREI